MRGIKQKQNKEEQMLQAEREIITIGEPDPASFTKAERRSFLNSLCAEIMAYYFPPKAEETVRACAV